MAKMVLLAAFCEVNGNDLSEYSNKIELKAEVEEKDVTTYGSEGWKELLGGLRSGELSLEFKQDVATGELDDIMWPLLGMVVPFSVRLDQAAVGPSNPAYSGSCLIKGWNPIEGSVGDDATVKVSFTTSGKILRTVA